MTLPFDTRGEARRRNAPRAGTQRARVLDAIRRADFGLTDEEIGVATGLPANSVRPRRGELVEAGWVEDSKVRRSNRQGNAMIVWRLSDEAL